LEPSPGLKQRAIYGLFVVAKTRRAPILSFERLERSRARARCAAGAADPELERSSATAPGLPTGSDGGHL
jgi:hypothetical protein